MAGFWAGFGQGFQAELDRAERRKMFNTEIAEKRKDTLLQIALTRGGATGGGGVSDGSSGGAIDVDAYISALTGMGANPDKIAEIVTEDPTGQSLATIYDEYQGLNPDIPRTGELLNQMVEGTVVSVRMDEPIDFAGIYAAAGVELTPEEDQLIGGLGQSAPKVTTLTTVTPTKPLTPTEINAGLEPLKGVLAQALTMKELEAQRSGDATAASQYAQALLDLEAGVVQRGVDMLGAEAQTLFQPFFDQNPQFKDIYLGPYETIKPGNQAATPQTASAGSPVGTIRVGRGGVNYRKLNDGPDSVKENWEQVQ